MCNINRCCCCCFLAPSPATAFPPPPAAAAATNASSNQLRQKRYEEILIAASSKESEYQVGAEAAAAVEMAKVLPRSFHFISGFMTSFFPASLAAAGLPQVSPLAFSIFSPSSLFFPVFFDYFRHIF